MGGRTRVVAGMGGLLVGVLVAGVLVVSWRGEEEPPLTGPPAVAQFLAAWERSRTATFSTRAEVVRTTPRGGMTSELEVVQRPPDVLRRQHGAIQGRLDGRVVSCGMGADDVVRCGPGADAGDFEAEVAAELAAWEEQVAQPGGIYLLSTRGDGCFDLTLARLVPSPPYGTAAQFCFDGATGAMVSSRIERAEGTDVMSVTEIRAEVVDADFALPG